MARVPSSSAISCASTVLLASSAVLSVPAVASADAPACQGKPATIVGPNNGQSTDGTPGDDIIVTTAEGANGRGTINAGDGDDVLCIVPGAGVIPNPRADPTFHVRMGAGDDTVVVEETRNTSYLRVELGDGDDTFLGSSRPEVVFAGAASVSYPELGGDFGRDHIDAGPGKDTIYSGSPSPDIVNDDTVISGPGGDSLYIGGKGASLDNGGAAGDGTGDSLAIIHQQWLQRRVTVDNAARVAASDAGELMRWTNVRYFHVLVDSPLTFTGSHAAEVLTVSTSLSPKYRYATTVDASMGSGDDGVRYASGAMDGTIDGGAGTDALELPRCSTLTFRVGRRFDCRETDADHLRYEFSTDITGFEGRTLLMAGRRAVVVGTSDDDDVVVWSRRALVRGRGGDDRLEVSRFARTKVSKLSGGRGNDVLIGGHRADRLEGGSGNDRLIGRVGNDDLIGGPGKDVARGGPGRDTCSAETRLSCRARRTTGGPG